jgi:hypothetical protein
VADKRWKDVERKTAAKLTEILSGVGNFTPVERIPLLGREGPDLTVNESGLVVNVKSRERILTRLMAPAGRLIYIGTEFVGFRLDHLHECNRLDYCATTPWPMLTEWYCHMDKWTKQFQSEGISSIFLHRPRMPIGLTTVVIHHHDLRRLQCNLNPQTVR